MSHYRHATIAKPTALERARWAFHEIRGEAGYFKREREIAAMPTVMWRGRTLFTIRCRGDYGKGPHTLNVPESLLWSLISLTHFTCVYHTR